MKTITLLLLASSAAQLAAQSFQKAIDAATVATASSPVRNTGQAVHIMTVLIPSSASNVTGFSARLEASYDGSTWVPISEDITTARTTGVFAYAITRANGVYPNVRARLVTAAASKAVTIYYSSAAYPIGQFIFDGNRWLSESKNPLVASWSLCAGTNCATGTNLTNQYIVAASSTVTKCFIAAKTAPAGAALKVNVWVNGSTSIFGVTLLQLADGATTGSAVTFAAPTLLEGDRLTIDITQVGSSTAGQDLTVACRLQ